MVALVAALKIYVVSEGDMFVFAMPSGAHIALFQAGEFCRFRSLEGRTFLNLAISSVLSTGAGKGEKESVEM